MIGPYGAEIAAIALANGCTLVTHNATEFSRVPGLLIEDWQHPEVSYSSLSSRPVLSPSRSADDSMRSSSESHRFANGVSFS